MQHFTFAEIQQRLSQFTVGIAGAGGLGSNCAVALARIGIGKLVIADFDVVQESNLNRQYYFRQQVGEKKINALQHNITLINPDVQVQVHDLKITASEVPDLFKDCHIVVEAFDKAAEKLMLIEAMQQYFPDMPLVCGVGMAGYGANGIIKTRNMGNIYICGDEQTEVAPNMPPLAPRVGIVANMQANVVIELLLDENFDATC